jgi:hypothetical protein
MVPIPDGGACARRTHRAWRRWSYCWLWRPRCFWGCWSRLGLRPPAMWASPVHRRPAPVARRAARSPKASSGGTTGAGGRRCTTQRAAHTTSGGSIARPLQSAGSIAASCSTTGRRAAPTRSGMAAISTSPRRCSRRPTRPRSAATRRGCTATAMTPSCAPIRWIPASRSASTTPAVGDVDAGPAGLLQRNDRAGKRQLVGHAAGAAGRGGHGAGPG